MNFLENIHVYNDTVSNCLQLKYRKKLSVVKLGPQTFNMAHEKHHDKI